MMISTITWEYFFDLTMSFSPKRGLTRLVLAKLLVSEEHLQRLRLMKFSVLVTLEYGAAVWDPYLQKDICNIEMVQQYAIHWVNSDYRFNSSISPMLSVL